MLTPLFWIDGPWAGRVAISARPRGESWLEDEVRAWRAAGVDAVVSLLTPEEENEMGLEEERNYCVANGIDFYSLPTEDRSVPHSSGAAELVTNLSRELAGGKSIAVHCRQGIGRAALIAAGLLIEAGLNPAEAIQRVAIARHTPVPETPEQREWIDSFGATLQQSRRLSTPEARVMN